MAASLSVPAVIQGMADALPTHHPEDHGSDVASSYEAIALLVHSYLTALSFRLCGFTEDKPIPECEALAPRLPLRWNAGFGSLSFVYKHKQSSMQFLIKVDRMGSKVEIRGLAIGHEKIHRLERTVRDVVQSSNLPVRITMKDGREDRTDLAEKLSKVFVSEEAVAGILEDLKVKVVQKLIPKLQVAGYEETADAEEIAREERRAHEARALNRPFIGEPHPSLTPFNPEPLPQSARPRPHVPTPDFPPPRFEDEYEIERLRDRQLSVPGRHPYNIGHDDLNPPSLGPYDPLRPSLTGGGLPLPGGPSGMHPTFDDPLFGLHGDSRRSSTGGAFDPQVPPGARWDPLGPGGDPRFPGRGSGGGPSGGPGSGGGFGSFGGGFGRGLY
ncbi:uncharacterized protein UV8b_06777 [Ustilaginoidea virens]|uniref:Proteasome inhibitor PI31 subunit n=1 Tax=Ustilaginoidea virens TaxID=1159556 RepID=A0A8E5MK62_USTVR|nr:uncharacterized protein UV8b_06777 [Ustilaginoidea virens]QUC22536.1 hypothetical protein UV8b_06777 [Ustilaginoidea virens]